MTKLVANQHWTFEKGKRHCRDQHTGAVIHAMQATGLPVNKVVKVLRAQLASIEYSLVPTVRFDNIMILSNSPSEIESLQLSSFID